MSRLALFDLDNTLLDRESAFHRWIDRFVAQYDLPESARSFIVRVDEDGASPREFFFEEIREEFGLASSIDALLARYYVDYIACFEIEATTVPGLRSLRADGWKIAVVTNGPPSQIKKMEATGLVGEFDAISISEVVGARKPHREIFEDAAARCGAPLQGWMVGDAPSADIAGGQGVGLRTIWMSRGRAWDNAAPAPDFTATSIAEAIRIIARSSGEHRLFERQTD